MLLSGSVSSLCLHTVEFTLLWLLYFYNTELHIYVSLLSISLMKFSIICFKHVQHDHKTIFTMISLSPLSDTSSISLCSILASMHSLPPTPIQTETFFVIGINNFFVVLFSLKPQGRGGLAVKSPQYSYRGLEFSSQHSGGSQLPITLGPGI